MKRALSIAVSISCISCCMSIACADTDTIATESAAEPNPPVLVQAATHCQDRSAPLSHARSLSADAQAAIERYVFDPEVASHALSKLSEAVLCFELGRDPAHASHARLLLARFEARVDTDFREHRARLQRALDTQHAESARAESRSLLALLGRRESDYSRWLTRIDRGEL